MMPYHPHASCFWLSTRSPESPWRYAPYLLPHHPSPFVTVMAAGAAGRDLWADLHEEEHDGSTAAASSQADAYEEEHGSKAAASSQARAHEEEHGSKAAASASSHESPWANMQGSSSMSVQTGHTLHRPAVWEEYYMWALIDRDVKEQLESWARGVGKKQLWPNEGGPWFRQEEGWLEVSSMSYEFTGRVSPQQFVPRQNMVLTMLLFLNNCGADPDCRLNVMQHPPWAQYMLCLTGSPKFFSRGRGRDSNVNQVISGRLRDIYHMAHITSDPLILKSSLFQHPVAHSAPSGVDTETRVPHTDSEKRSRVRDWKSAMAVEGPTPEDQIRKLGCVLYQALLGSNTKRNTALHDVAVALVNNGLSPPPDPCSAPPVDQTGERPPAPCPRPSVDQTGKRPPAGAASAKTPPAQAKAAPPVYVPDDDEVPRGPEVEAASAVAPPAQAKAAPPVFDEATTASDEATTGVPKTAGDDEVPRGPEVEADPFAELCRVFPMLRGDGEVPREPEVSPPAVARLDSRRPLIDLSDGNFPPNSYPNPEDFDDHARRPPPDAPTDVPDPRFQVDPPGPPPLPWASSSAETPEATIPDLR